MPRRRIIIVDDHPLFRSALRQTLAGGDPSISVEEAGDLAELSAALEADRDCDLVLLDLNMPGTRGFSGLLLLRAQYPEIPVMIVSAVEDGGIIRRAFADRAMKTALTIRVSSSGRPRSGTPSRCRRIPFDAPAPPAFPKGGTRLRRCRRRGPPPR